MEAPAHRRNRGSGVLHALVLPKTRNRTSKEVSQDQTLAVRHHNAQQVPLLPPDHPHAKPQGSENVDPQGSPTTQSPRKSRRDEAKESKRSKSTVSLRTLVGGDSKAEKEEKRKSKDLASDKKSLRRPKKEKSSTGLSALFSKKNKSSKDLSCPDPASNETAPSAHPAPVETPIWAQYASQKEADAPMKNPRVRPDVSDDRLKCISKEIDRYTPKDDNPYKARDFGPFRPTLSRPTSSYRPQSGILSPSAPMLMDLQKALEAAQRSHIGSRGSDKSRVSVKGVGVETSTAPSSRPQSTILEPSRQVSGSSTEQAPAKDIAVTKRGAKVAAAVSAIDGKAPVRKKTETATCDAKEVEKAFEAVLERRNIPEDQRRSMRSLTLHVKADFVKQDEKASRPSSPVKNPSQGSLPTCAHPAVIETKGKSSKNEEVPKSPGKRDRPRSRTFHFTRTDTSPMKKQRGASRPTSIQDASQITRNDLDSTKETVKTGSFGRSTQRPALPEEYVQYLQRMQDPTQAEVGRVHKLRILLRNETVAWVDSFIELGGMTEITGLLYRIMAIEWREDHEDQLLHEALLCLKGISTTKSALLKFEEVADELFPKLIHLIFDEEKKGPSEFATRNIIITVLFAYLSSASTSSASALRSRAERVLVYLEDPKPTSKQPLPFVLEMQTRRPYRTWCREVANVTKEVFWIFLHTSNIVPLPATPSDTEPLPNGGPSPDDDDRARFPSTPALPSAPGPASTYTSRHFPTTRPPVPAAPYIGGVEWDATTYLTAHLDLLNGLVASLPSATERNALRADLRSSGWEKVMGATLRTCKEKFYAGVHDALRTWVGAANEDGWEVRGVRTGVWPGTEGNGVVAPATKKERLNKEDKEKLVLPELDLGPKKKGRAGRGGEEGWLI